MLVHSVGVHSVGEGFAIRVVLGLGDGVGDGEEGGVRGDSSGMDGSRKIMR